MQNLFSGMHPDAIEGEIERQISQVGIGEYADRKCGTYSGGNKRKLNVAQVNDCLLLLFALTFILPC